MDFDHLFFERLWPALIAAMALVGLFLWRALPLGKRLLRTIALIVAVLIVSLAIWGPLIIALNGWPRVTIFLEARNDALAYGLIAALAIVSLGAAAVAWRTSAARGTAVRAIAAAAALVVAPCVAAAGSVFAVDAADAGQNHAALMTQYWWATSYDFLAVAAVDPARGKKMQHEAYAAFRANGARAGDIRKIYADDIAPMVARATDEALVAVLDARTGWLEAAAARGKNACLHVLRTDVFGPLQIVDLGKAYGDAIGAAYRSGRDHPEGAPAASEDDIAAIEEAAASLPANPLTPEEREIADDDEKIDASCAARAKWLRNMEALGTAKAAADARYHLARER